MLEITVILLLLKLLMVSILHNLTYYIDACNTHTDVFLSLNGNIIPDHGYVNISDIGSTVNTALLCITNRPGSPTSGNWYAPDGTRVVDTDVPGFSRNRGSMVVRLFRMGSETATEGIYYCTIQDSTPTFHMVNVGLYNSGGGNNK